MAKPPSRPRKPRPVGAPVLASNVADLRALAHPLRLRMLELFAEQPRTTKQVAELLDQPPTRLYHHVAALERSGLLILKETRPNRGVVEKWYEAVAKQMSASGSAAAPRVTKSARRAVAMTVLEQTRQEMIAASSGGTTEPVMLVRLIVAGKPEMIPAVRKRLLAAVKEIQNEFQCDDPPGSNTDDHDRWALTMAFAPVWPRPRRKAR